MNTVQTYMDLINERVNEIIAKTNVLDEDTIRWKLSENNWSIMEIMCHVEEFITFWTGELINVIHNSSAHFGRKLNEKERHATVENANYRTMDQMLKSLEDTKQHTLNVLSNFSSSDLQVESVHINPKHGIKPMTFVLNKFVLEHLNIHILQIERNLQMKSNNEVHLQ
jgi:hypothetical protein